MKKNFLFILSIGLLCASLLLLMTGCAALKTEFFGSAPPSVSSTSNSVSGDIVPPVAAQLNAAAPIVQAVIPAPWGTLVAALMNLAATGAAAFATFHARGAAVAAQVAASKPT